MLVGVDIYLIPEEGIPTFTGGEFDPFKCKLISDRETNVRPGFVSPDRLTANWYRCRFMSTRAIADAELNALLAELSKKGWRWFAAQKLWSYTDLCPGLVDGMSFTPGESIGDNTSVIEVAHGSATKH